MHQDVTRSFDVTFAASQHVRRFVDVHTERLLHVTLNTDMRRALHVRLSARHVIVVVCNDTNTGKVTVRKTTREHEEED